MAWQFLLTDLNGNVHGEVTNASERKVVLPHLRVPSCSFKVPLWHPLAPKMMDEDCLVRAYRTDPVTAQKSLAFHGPVVSADENAEDGQSVAVACAGPFWRLSKRLIPASKTKSGFAYGSEADPRDLGEISRVIISDTNGTNYTGISNGTWAASRNGFVSKWYLKYAAEAVAELAAGLGSFEHRVRPTEPTDVAGVGGWPQIGLFDVAPLIGQTRPDAIFEYGTPRANVASYTRTVSREGLLTSGLISVSGWPDGVEKVPNTGDPGTDKYNLVERFSDAVAARGMFEDVVNDAGILDDGLRTGVLDYHLDIRKRPRQIITFKPVVNARPAAFVDYEVGDTVRARAVVGGTLRFDALFRIWGLTFDIDQNGNETVELELVMP